MKRIIGIEVVPVENSHPGKLSAIQFTWDPGAGEYSPDVTGKQEPRAVVPVEEGSGSQVVPTAEQPPVSIIPDSELLS